MPMVDWTGLKESGGGNLAKEGFDPWPKGSRTRCMIERVTHEARPGKGRCFGVGFRSVEGDNEGEWAWMNAWTIRETGRDTDSQTVDIGLRKIATLYDVLGLELPEDSDDLNVSHPMEMLVTVVAGKPNTWRDRENATHVSTEIVGFESAVPKAPLVSPQSSEEKPDDGLVF